MENLFKLNTNENFTEDDAKYGEILLEPWCHFNSENKGVDFHKRYIQAFNYWLKLNETEVELAMDFFKWLHTVYILLDDILDSSEQRRGGPAAYVLYGAARTILAIDFCTVNFCLTGKSNPFSKFKLLKKFKLHEVRANFTDGKIVNLEFDNIIYRAKVLQEPCNTEIFQTMAMDYIGQGIIQGQTMETYWRDNYTCSSEEECLLMLYRKGGHFLLAVNSFMQVFTKTKIDLSKLSLLVGTYFQLTDDYRGLTSNLMCESKGFCDEIREGKFTLPFVHAIKSRPNDKRLIGILKMRTDDIDLKKKCLELLEEFGSMEFTKNKIFCLKNLIKEEIQRLGLNDDKFKILFELHNYDH